MAKRILTCEHGAVLRVQLAPYDGYWDDSFAYNTIDNKPEPKYLNVISSCGHDCDQQIEVRELSDEEVRQYRPYQHGGS